MLYVLYCNSFSTLNLTTCLTDLSSRILDCKGGEKPADIPSVKVGTTVTLACPVFGFPTPAISWRYPNGTMKIDRSTNILPAQIEKESDIGTYYCSGCGKNFTFKLKLSIPPTAPGKFTLSFWICYLFEAVNFSTTVRVLVVVTEK